MHKGNGVIGTHISDTSLSMSGTKVASKGSFWFRKFCMDNSDDWDQNGYQRYDNKSLRHSS